MIDFGVVETLRRRIELSLPGLHHRTRDVLTDTASDAAALSSATAIIIGVRDRLGAPSTTAIEQLRAVSPHVGVFVVTDANVQVEPWLQRHAHAGTDEIFCFDSDAGRSAFADRIRFLVSAPAPEIALRELWQFWEPLFIRSEAMYCVRNGYRLDGFSPNQWFGVSEKKFRTRFRGLSQPTPWTLGRLGRQLRVSELKLRGYHTMAEVATLLGFETAMQLTADRRRLLVALQRWPRFRQLLGDT